MQEIQCPTVLAESKVLSLFLAGGITNCPDWQHDLVSLLAETNLTILNPRRTEYEIGNLALEEDQIKWEHKHFVLASAFVFWFPCETVCPITLFELGRVIEMTKPTFVGTHHEYSRKRDIRWQLLLSRPAIDVVHSLGALAEQVKTWCTGHPIPV
ncbi:MAG: nucleoside 2-deoxyribosyltransferase domain-containing protein [Promethearchaeota archaeon]|jgi:hypothetical protein